eukprot:COSAG06_NODE_4_length_41837_cov_204.557597_17_plen_84_part_00
MARAGPRAACAGAWRRSQDYSQARGARNDRQAEAFRGSSGGAKDESYPRVHKDLQVRKRSFLRDFILKVIILSRQARDRHRTS